MPDGGELLIRTAMIEKKAVIEISDTGTGIELQAFDKIFQPYYTSKPGGSGIGLSIARKIVKAHDGSIAVNSQAGKGTSFTIILPVSSG